MKPGANPIVVNDFGRKPGRSFSFGKPRVPLVDSLLSAIVRADGDALVLHAGERPYVVAPSGQTELASRELTLDAMKGMLNELLPPEARQALEPGWRRSAPCDRARETRRRSASAWWRRRAATTSGSKFAAIEKALSLRKRRSSRRRPPSPCARIWAAARRPMAARQHRRSSRGPRIGRPEPIPAKERANRRTGGPTVIAGTAVERRRRAEEIARRTNRARKVGAGRAAKWSLKEQAGAEPRSKRRRSAPPRNLRRRNRRRRMRNEARNEAGGAQGNS